MTEYGEFIIELDNLSKVFLTDELESHALAGIQLKIQKGEYVSMEGPSGSGKTTLLSILGLLESPSGGNYTLCGQSVLGLTGRERALMRNQYIGFIFQAFNLIGELSVHDNVELPLLYRGIPGNERKKRVERALENVRMGHRSRHFPAQLSGGQQQRVAVARAIVCEPAVLLADEPTGNLDSSNGDAVMDLLRELHAGGATICMVTHNHQYARQASRSIHLFDGKLVDDMQQRVAE
jgi:putative ABC transport system ATP-binding protein